MSDTMVQPGTLSMGSSRTIAGLPKPVAIGGGILAVVVIAYSFYKRSKNTTAAAASTTTSDAQQFYVLPSAQQAGAQIATDYDIHNAGGPNVVVPPTNETWKAPAPNAPKSAQGTYTLPNDATSWVDSSGNVWQKVANAAESARLIAAGNSQYIQPTPGNFQVATNPKGDPLTFIETPAAQSGQ